MAEEVVHVFSCTFEGGGQTTVPAGSRIVLLFGWAAKKRGLVKDFLQAQTTTISLNGAAPIDISDSYSAVNEFPGGFFATNVRHDTGVTLSAGQSLQADGTITVSHPVPDFLDDAHRPVLVQPGDPISFSCRITASA
jgi:hypothetical protein